MIQSLLSLMLLATQVLSGNSAALYLCLEADGSVCVDFGPSACHCCHADDEAEHAACDHTACGSTACDHTAEHAACDHEHANAAGNDAQPCPCTHVQLSEPQTATVERVVSPPEDQQMIAPVAIVSLLVWTSAATVGDRPLSPLATCGASCALAERASVVLRC